MPWVSPDIPSQVGRLAIVTGVGGLGLETGLALARAGADVVLAGRNPVKGAAAVEQVRSLVPDTSVRFEQLDPASAPLAHLRAGLPKLAAPSTSWSIMPAS